jgi:hypothetical protein
MLKHDAKATRKPAKLGNPADVLNMDDKQLDAWFNKNVKSVQDVKAYLIKLTKVVAKLSNK